jgi:hypothetical protein
MTASDPALPRDDDEPADSVPWGDMLLAATSVILAGLIVAKRSALVYLGYQTGYLWGLWWTVPAVAVTSALITAAWALLHGGAHRAAYPLLLACAALQTAGVVAWEVTM